MIEFLDIEEVSTLFEIQSPFDIFSKESYFTLAKEYANIQGSRNSYNLHIYNERKEILGSSFSSYRKEDKAIGLYSVSNIRNYIDTGKVFKDSYTFYSSPSCANESNYNNSKK